MNPPIVWIIHSVINNRQISLADPLLEKLIKERHHSMPIKELGDNMSHMSLFLGLNKLLLDVLNY